MTVTFSTEDNEFAVSTGDNVTTSSQTSTFDYPPNSSMDLVVTSNADDASPYTFSLGDTYDVSYGGRGGGGVLEDATVIRSDFAPGGGGIIVFEGTDASSGETTQVVWTPDFDLESWYWDNFDRGQSPGFHTVDQQERSYSYVCFDAATEILTARGPVPAGALRLGDDIITQDSGPQPILWIGKRKIQLTQGNLKQHPICINMGALGRQVPNQALRLSPQHRVGVTIDGAKMLVPAKALLSQPGVHIDSDSPSITYVSLLLPCHSIISAAGLGCESLYPGPQAMMLLNASERSDLDQLFPGVTENPAIYGDMRYAAIGPSRFARISKSACIGIPAFAPRPPLAKAIRAD